MPEDYQTVLSELGYEAPAEEQSNAEPNVEQNVETEPEETTTDNPVEEQGDVEAIDKQRRANEAFAAMRSDNAKYKQFVQHLMKGAGFTGTEEDFVKQMTDVSYKQQAQRQGNQIDPNLLKRMDEIETQNKTLIETQNRNLFMSNLKGLQEKFELSESEIKEFVELAVREQIDLTVPGTNFITLYQGLFFDKLQKKLVEKERQNWIAQSNKANNATNPDGKSGKKDPAPTDVNTMAEFDSLLQSIPSNK